MWLSIWTVTVALVIGFAVIAEAVRSENDHAALGR